ncbi:DUF2953 domain-containing protein [Pseudalkalibacillus sp. Hm43]|uniref:DUF2953 domain-containing protein n=1 Tax=Pseudalkalibacillus sp. Hm43 TaxID=3450742 RepID=UPI003F43A186
MYWVIGILSILGLIIVLLMLSTVRISIIFVHDQNRDECKVRLHLLRGMFHYSWDIPFNEMEMEDDGLHMKYQTDMEVGEQDHEKEREAIFRVESIMERAQETKELIDSVYQMHWIIRRFLKRVRVEEFEWYSSLGTGDASSTGIFSGMLWTIKGSIVGMVSHLMKMLSPPKIEIQPSFQMPIVQTHFQCIISFRAGQAMLAAYQIAKNWKGRKQHVRTSNPGLDANGNGKY